MSAELQDMIVAGRHLERHEGVRPDGSGAAPCSKMGLIKASHGMTTLDEVTRLTLT